MLKIGLSACFMYPDPNREIFGPKTLLYMGHDMSHYLGLSGIMPILIPDLPCDKSFAQFIDQLDGVLFQGGMDINPEMYGETPRHFKWEGDPQRDLYELKIMAYALEKKMPILGICRGMQLINIHLGGTLYQDLDQMVDGVALHRDNELYDELIHPVEFVAGGLLEGLHRHLKGPHIINSVHHQGIKALGEGLTVEAISPQDQVIEAVSADGGQIVGIQWHPEFFHTMENQCMDASVILNFFIEKCRDYKEQH